jgi:anti-sigma regulatory factor (Ser/Thr protein kinase)
VTHYAFAGAIPTLFCLYRSAREGDCRPMANPATGHSGRARVTDISSLLPRRPESSVPISGQARPSARFQLDSDPAQVRRAREYVRQLLPGWGLGGHTELSEIIVSELVTNAIVHGAGPINVSVSPAHDELLIEVRDQGPGRPVRHQPTIDDESGRGLELIDGLLALHGGTRGVTEHRPGPGKTVHVRIALPEATGHSRNG